MFYRSSEAGDVQSALEMVELLWWNTSNDIHFSEFHIPKHLRTYREL
jgi:hypothetical protein